MDTAIVGSLVIAIVAVLKDLAPKMITGNSTRLVALLVGAGLGYFGVAGADIMSGVVAAAGAVGVSTLVDRSH